MMTHAKRGAARFVAAVTLLTAMVAAVPAASAGQSHRGGSGYGVQGGVTENLALASVYSGIYGLGYTYARVAPYHRPSCRDAAERLPDLQDLIVRRCP